MKNEKNCGAHVVLKWAENKEIHLRSDDWWCALENAWSCQATVWNNIDKAFKLLFFHALGKYF